MESHCVAVSMSVLQPVYSAMASQNGWLKTPTNLHLRRVTSPVPPPPDPPDPPDPPNLPTSFNGSRRAVLCCCSGEISCSGECSVSALTCLASHSSCPGHVMVEAQMVPHDPSSHDVSLPLQMQPWARALTFSAMCAFSVTNTSSLPWPLIHFEAISSGGQSLIETSYISGDSRNMCYRTMLCRSFSVILYLPCFFFRTRSSGVITVTKRDLQQQSPPTPSQVLLTPLALNATAFVACGTPHLACRSALEASFTKSSTRIFPSCLYSYSSFGMFSLMGSLVYVAISTPDLKSSRHNVLKNLMQYFVKVLVLVSLKISSGFIGVSSKNLSVDSLGPIIYTSLFSMIGDVPSDSFPSVWFNLFTGLLPCVAVCTGPEGAIETTSVFLVGEGWLSMSLVTKSQPSDFVVKALSTHLRSILNSLSTSYEELSCLIFLAVIAYVWFPRGCLILSKLCNL
ncbi:hypothetical protein N665_0098s0008 [Sinapis alba]|nr:hypothetical protein N665_0098s0008 [Sinapis alba]